MAERVASPVIAAVICRNGRYLVGRRPHGKRHGGLWEFPGGKMHPGESWLETAHRELGEELRMRAISTGGLLLRVADEGSPHEILFVEVEAGGEPVPAEHTAVGWFTPEELLALPLAPADARFARELGRGAGLGWVPGCDAELGNGPPATPPFGGEYSLRILGHVRSPLRDLAEAPRMGSEGAPDAWLELDPAYLPALRGVEAGAEIVLVTWLHLASREVLEVHPRGDRERPLRGVFSTRSPARPNPLGLHRVTVCEISGARMRVGPLEAVDGTPVVDIKPVLEGGADG